MTSTLFEYAGHDYWVHDSGFLECRECTEFWCQHIQLLVSVNADSDTIWLNKVGDKLVDEQTVEVPIIPTSAQWALCHLKYRDKVMAYEVTLINSDKPSVFIGFINRGEARMVLRSMVVDWFRGNVNTDHLECPQTGHSYSSEMRWQKDMNDPQKSFGQFWSVWANEKCLGCSSASDDFSDLVPDAVPSNNFPRS